MLVISKVYWDANGKRNVAWFDFNLNNSGNVIIGDSG